MRVLLLAVLLTLVTLVTPWSTYLDIYRKYDDISIDENLVNFCGEVIARRDALEEGGRIE